MHSPSSVPAPPSRAMIQQHTRNVETIRNCRTFFLGIRGIVLSSLETEEELAWEQQQQPQRQQQQQQQQQQHVVVDLDRILLRDISRRCHNECELVRFPLVEALERFHSTALAYASGNASLGGAPALVSMSKSLMPLLRRRCSLLMRCLFHDFDNDKPVPKVIEYEEQDDDEHDEKSQHRIVTTTEGGELSDYLLGASNCYFSLRRLNPKENMRLVSDIAPLMLDLAAFEIPLVELLEEGWQSMKQRQHQQQRQAYDPAAALERVEKVSARLPCFTKRDDAVQIISRREQEFVSGYSGRVAEFIRLFREGDGALLRATQDELDEAEEERRRREAREHTDKKSDFSFARRGLVNMFLSSLGKTKREQLLVEQQEKREQKERERRERLLAEQRRREEQLPSKLVPGGTVAAALADAAAGQRRSRGSGGSSCCFGNDDGGAAAPIRRLPFELLDYIFCYLLPSEVVNAANTASLWQRVVLMRVPLRRRAQLSVTFTRRVKFFINQQLGAHCVCVDVVPANMVPQTAAAAAATAAAEEEQE